MQEFIHFIGIGGIGVSALAQVAQARGARVSGSDSNADPASNPALARLIQHGAECYTGHRRENVVEGVSLVVATAAVGSENPEIEEARSRGIRLVSRAEYLGELMAAHAGPTVAVAGTHGKTTTTAMLGVMLQHAGLDPTVFVGGEVAQLGGNVWIGSPGGPFVAEACEAYDSFLHLHPDLAIITNVEADHLDHYGTEEGVFEGFRKFLGGIAPGGTIVACGDDAGVQRLMGAEESDLRKNAVFYGIEPGAEVSARSLELGHNPEFILNNAATGEHARVTLGVPGRHNVANALAAAAAGLTLNAPVGEIAAGLSEFRGAGRRQDLLGEAALDGGAALVFDDYAHHPTEIRATLDALRSAYPGRRLVAVFQPHLYSRTRDFLAEFAGALAQSDVLVVTGIYAAREAPIEGVDAAAIVDIARRERLGLDARFISDKREIPSSLSGIVRADDVVVFMGAGDIREQGEVFVKRGTAAGAAR
jgi:UDP-N-acetylmuramate--alanine ligase